MRRFTLVKTCGGCPEQYDVYFEGKAVGYMRLRHGHFRAEHDDKVVYSASPDGDGVFEDCERVGYLNAACEAIDMAMDGKTKPGQEPMYDVAEEERP